MDRFQRDVVDLLPRLRRLARAIARDLADADDLVQVTLERALARRQQWRPGTRLDSWMFRIMKNAWIDESRTRTRRPRIFSPEAAGETVGAQGSDALDTRIEAARAARAMARLPDDQRIAVAMVLVDGLSYREAADALEIPMGTLTSRLVRGRTSLLADLQGKGVQP